MAVLHEYACGECGTAIAKVVTPRGRLISVNHEPDSKGMYVMRVVTLKNKQTRLAAVKLSRVEQIRALEDGELLYRLHHPVCGLEVSAKGTPIPTALRDRAAKSIAAGKEKFR